MYHYENFSALQSSFTDCTASTSLHTNTYLTYPTDWEQWQWQIWEIWRSVACLETKFPSLNFILSLTTTRMDPMSIIINLHYFGIKIQIRPKLQMLLGTNKKAKCVPNPCHFITCRNINTFPPVQRHHTSIWHWHCVPSKAQSEKEKFELKLDWFTFLDCVSPFRLRCWCTCLAKILVLIEMRMAQWVFCWNWQGILLLLTYVLCIEMTWLRPGHQEKLKLK